MADNARLSVGGKDFELPVVVGTENERGIDIGKLLASSGHITLDDGYANTGATQSNITFLDGDRGILRYRGYPIEQLAENCTFLEVAYLLLYGELPTPDELGSWNEEVLRHVLVHENVKKFMDGFHHDAHPMGILMSTVAALSTFYPEARHFTEAKSKRLQIVRLIGKMPTLASYAFRHRMGMPYVF